MCGIWLLLTSNKYKLDDSLIFKLSQNIKARGPTNYNFISLPSIKDVHQPQYNLYFCFHRLSINGLNPLANQPFIYDNENESIYVLCNGEIYNYKQLATKYEIQLNTGSDCEILYPLYEKIGIENMLKEIDGEFAFIFCIIDKQTNEVNLVISRDQCGIRPLFYSHMKNQHILISSELKGMVCDEISFKGTQFPPRNYATFTLESKFFNEYLNFRKILPTENNLEQIKDTIYNKLYESVNNRLLSDQEIGCLLSGGLDSSLISAITADILRKQGKTLKTFCIGMSENSPDIINAQKVADYIGSEHKTIILSENIWTDAIETVIKIIESYDITTIRASTGQYLVSKWIAENTNIKVLLIGDGSDELTGGYIYMLNAPNEEEFDNETKRLLEEIHLYDVLRSDRGISDNGLEARVPFLSKDFISYYLSINSEIRKPKNGNIEKHLLRSAFEKSKLLPQEILYRKKEAFSDGISNLENSWFKITQKHAEEQMKKYNMVFDNLFKHCPPQTNEAYYYRKIFTMIYNEKNENVIDKFWLPKWMGDVIDPSARILLNYKNN